MVLLNGLSRMLGLERIAILAELGCIRLAFLDKVAHDTTIVETKTPLEIVVGVGLLGRN
jgi:hypothetical protein